MSGKLSYERFLWFHGEIKRGLFPNASHMAKQFEICRKTAQRDVEFMRDRLGAPLEYLPGERGYAYTDSSFELSSFWLTRDDLISLTLANRLASIIPDRRLKSGLKDFLRRFVGSISPDGNFEAHSISDKVSIKNIEFYSVDEHLFSSITRALFNNNSIEIGYYSPHKDEETFRHVLPLHLLGYMGNWHLIAWCGMRAAIRNFALSRIKVVQEPKSPLALPESLPSMKDYIRRHFGIFSGGDSDEVKLRFSPEASRWVREQRWHPGQLMSWDKERLCLTLPVSDFREIKREILKFGADVEVLEPKSLREEVRGEIKKMKKIYR